MNKQKILRKMDEIEEIAILIFRFLFIYGFAVGFIMTGIVLFLTPYSDALLWGGWIIGTSFFLMGLYFLFMAIKYTLEILE